MLVVGFRSKIAGPVSTRKCTAHIRFTTKTDAYQHPAFLSLGHPTLLLDLKAFAKPILRVSGTLHILQNQAENFTIEVFAEN